MVLALERVTRVYDGRRALDEVSFTVRPGRTTGFVGANGAGKTTAMRIVMGVLAPTSGEVLLGRPAAHPCAAPHLRLHAGGARAVPADAGARPARAPGSGARHVPRSRDATRDGAARPARPRRAQPRPAPDALPGQPAACAGRRRAAARAGAAGARRAVLRPGPAGDRRDGRAAARAAPRRGCPCCSAPTSSSWSSSCATTWSSSTTAGWSLPGRPTRCGPGAAAGATGCGCRAGARRPSWCRACRRDGGRRDRRHRRRRARRHRRRPGSARRGPGARRAA